MAGISVNFEVLNQLNTPTLYADTLALRPAPAIVGRIFFRTDAPYGIYRDTGTSWDLISSVDTTGITGSIAAGQVGYGSGTNTLAGNNNLFWDATNSRLGIKTITPGVELDVHGSGVIMQLNGTGTNNSFLTFQNAGVNEWRIGNNYSGATNFFTVHDSTNNSDILQINAGTTALNSQTTLRSLLNTTYTQTGIAAATSLSYSQIGTNNTFNAGITRSSTFEIGLSTSAIFTFSGTYTKSFGSMTAQYNEAWYQMNGNVTFTQPSYILPFTCNSNGLVIAGSGTLSHLANIITRGDFLASGSVTVTNRYQILVNNITAIGGGTYTNRWGIYQEGTSDNNYFGGKILIGTTTVPTQILSVNGTSLFSGNITIADNINIITNTTTGTRIATATNQKISFWNATPIVQPTTATTAATFVANAGTAINTLSTFDGYTVGSVVRALRNAGLLA